MKLDFNAVLHSIFGKPMRGEPIFDETTKEVTGHKDATLGAMCIEALFSEENAKGLSGAKKFENHQLGARIVKSMETKELLDLKIEEVSLIKELIGKGMNTAGVGAVWSEIERQASAGRAAKEEAKPEEVK